MTACRAGVSLRSVAVTPDRIPTFLIPCSACRTPLLFRSPRAQRDSPDRARLLSGDSSDTSPDNRRSSRLLLRPLTPGPAARIRRNRNRTAEELEAADTDLSTRAAMSLPHVDKVTTPYGFRAVLAASPCTRRRESLFHHRSAAAPVTSTEPSSRDRKQRESVARDVNPAASPKTPGASRMSVKALGLQMMKEFNKSVAALRGLTPGTRSAVQR